MKQRIAAFLLLAALLLSTVSCGTKTEDSPYLEGDFDTSGEIVLRVEHPVYDKSVNSFHYYVENHTERQLTFGAPYSIEVLRDGVWQSLPLREDAAWNDIAYVLEAGGEWSNSFSFFSYDYEVVDGRYRLIKEIEGKRYAAEFTIGESEITEEHPFGYEDLEELPETLDLSALEYDLLINAAGEVAGGSEERIMAFLDEVALGAPAMLRLVCVGLGGEAVLYDVIYQNNHFLWRRDATRGGNVSAIEERRYSFLVTDGEAIYLSDTASLREEDLAGRSITAGRYTIFQSSWFENFTAIDQQVEEITKNHLASSVVLARFWSEDGTYWLDLTAENMDYLVSTKGYGMGRTLTECKGEKELEIVAVRWENDTQVRLMCLPVEKDKDSREPGWYAVFDTAQEKVISSGRSLWNNSYSSGSIVEQTNP